MHICGWPAIQITKFNLLKSVNAKANRTVVYDTDQLVLRRGNDFKVKFNLSTDFNPKIHKLNVEFHRGDSPNFKRGTRFECIIGRPCWRAWEWKGSINSRGDATVKASLHIPADCPVGEYKVRAEAIDTVSKKRSTSEAPASVAIIFNAWDTDDDVYLDDPRAKREYVLGQSGKLWTGSVHNQLSRQWEFEQFESYSLNAALYLLDRFELDSELRRSPVHVSRTCATMVNANDNDGGILIGNWSGNYAPHTSPSSWSGSGAILEQFWRTKKAVKYAQCWVFGGTLTSVLRTLGIPARPITNYMSAHDTNANRTLELYLGEDLKILSAVTADTYWNYHIWVEGWMERPDLKGGVYGGWQALDSTPQEPSADAPGVVTTLGPCPVACVKEGATMKYDSEFLYSEVNADVTWYQYTNNTTRFLQTKTDQIGLMICTKAILSQDREVITDSYKHKEHSLEERAAFGQSTKTAVSSDVDIEIVMDKTVLIGKDLAAKVVFKSSSAHLRTVEYVVHLRSVTYAGAQGDLLMEIKETISIQPMASGVEVPIRLTPEEYVGKVSEQLLVDITVFASVPDREAFLLEKETFRFRTPDLDLAAPAGMKAGETSAVTASFRNPLDQALTNVEWFVEGAGLTKPLTLDGSKVPARGQASVQFNITAKNDVEPTRSLTVTFESAQLEGVMGSVQVQIN
nr:protein-glutamine gamma-glutamyltransferase K-like isoform X4 [Halisarca dujardinii]